MIALFDELLIEPFRFHLFNLFEDGPNERLSFQL